MKVRFLSVEARSVFNLTSPRYLPQLSLDWRGKREWWHRCYEPLRDLCERRYIEEFNNRTGHYDCLEESIIEEGFRNPVMLTAGRLLRRNPLELPPDLRVRGDALVCEYVGGSRLLIAAKLGLWLPAIINDFRADAEGGVVINTGDTPRVLSLFTDRPREITWLENGALYVNYLPYTHYQRKRRISATTQRTIRKDVLAEVFKDVSTWIAQNDNDDSERLPA